MRPKSFQQEIIIRMRPDSDKCHKRALKVAAAVSGVESITVTGRDKDLLLVIGDGVDANKLTKKLKKEVGEVEIVELRTLAAADSSDSALPSTSSRSPSYQWHSAPGRSLQGGERAAYSVSAPSAAASPGLARRWPGEHSRQAAGASYYYPRPPNPSYYYASPVAGDGAGYGGSSYARAVARSHPGNYSPMIERHDYHGAGHESRAGRHRHRHRHRHGGGGGGEPSCCSIL